MQHSDDQSNESAEPTPAYRTPSHWVIFAALAFWLSVGIALSIYFGWWEFKRDPLPDDPDAALQIAVKEADRLDPGWSFEELESKRAAIADADNSARCVLAAHECLPKKWPTWRSLDRLAGRELDSIAHSRYETDLRKVPVEVQFNKQQLSVLKGELREAEAALTEARKLADLPRGRLPLAPPSKSALPGSNPHLIRVREIMALLGMDIWVLAQDRQFDDALASCRALLNAGRAIGDKSDSVAQLVRLAAQSTAVYKLERILAQGAPSSDALASMQQLLEEEARTPILLMMARGERARIDSFLRKIQDGTFPQSKMDQMEKLAISLHGGEKKDSASSNEKWYFPQRIKWYRAWYLRYATDLVEICKKPEPPPMEALKKLEATLKGQPAFLQVSGGGKEQFVESYGRRLAQLRCAAVAVAAERYRQANGQWPASLDKLVPGQIARIPADPYDGRRLRYCRVREGVGIYSIGPDGKDDNGDLRDSRASQQAADVGFRLWNPSLRRQPSHPEQPLNELPGIDDE